MPYLKLIFDLVHYQFFYLPSTLQRFALSFLEVASQVSHPYMTTNKMNKLCIKQTSFGVMGQQTNVGIWTLSLFEKILKIMRVKNSLMDMTCFLSSPIKHNIFIMVHKG